MCRIAGFWDLNFKADYNLEEAIIEMRDVLVHGGPDDGGIFIDIANAVALGHRRLSILDLSTMGRQPMKFDNLVIVYNGEVYNFKEIRAELMKYGYKFHSNTDTEVILKAFHMWGLDCIHKFRGMWAFAIWNKKKCELILCRDRVGVKPLYWYYKNRLFMFASELKAFHKHPRFKKTLNNKVLPFYLKYGYIPSPYSIFQNTYKLEPGSFLIIDRYGKITLQKYWDIESHFFDKERHENLKKKREEEVIEELESILIDSFKLRLVSDVPVGVFLSGGIDSSLVTTLLQKETLKPLKTFTIGFYEKEYNEAPYAKRIAEYLGTDHYEFYITPKEAREVIFYLPEIYDEPFGDSSAVPTYLVSKYARREVKVVLSADGGDEQFCGYTNYWPVLKLARINSKIPCIIRQFLSGIGRKTLVYNLFKPFASRHLSNFRDKYFKLLNALIYTEPIKIFDISKSFYFDNELYKLLKFDFNPPLLYKGCDSIDVLQCMMMEDIKTYMIDDILVKVDRATMKVALEAREPLLDHKILEFSSALPVNYKCNNGITKYILRKILYKYVPKELIERPKKGFGMPVYEWFRKELRELYEYYLSEKKLKESGVFNESFIRSLLKQYYKGEPVNSSRFWLLLMFQMWKEKWM